MSDLAQRLLNGDKRALARGISLVEDDVPAGWDLVKAVYPKTSDEAMERVKLISQENAQLRAELGSVKDRLAVIERIVTDEGHRLSHEIEALRRPSN